MDIFAQYVWELEKNEYDGHIHHITDQYLLQGRSQIALSFLTLAHEPDTEMLERLVQTEVVRRITEIAEHPGSYTTEDSPLIKEDFDGLLYEVDILHHFISNYGGHVVLPFEVRYLHAQIENSMQTPSYHIAVAEAALKGMPWYDAAASNLMNRL